MQDLFCKSKAQCVQEVLSSGLGLVDSEAISLEELEPFWQDVFEKELEVDDRVP
jgi:hypothetical protein